MISVISISVKRNVNQSIWERKYNAEVKSFQHVMDDIKTIKDELNRLSNNKRMSECITITKLSVGLEVKRKLANRISDNLKGMKRNIRQSNKKYQIAKNNC